MKNIKSGPIIISFIIFVLLFFIIETLINNEDIFVNSNKMNLMQTRVQIAKQTVSSKPANTTKINEVKEEKKGEISKQSLTPHSEIFNKKPGESFFFGKFEQDADFENGPEPIEWIVLENVNQEKIIAISKMALAREVFTWSYYKLKDQKELSNWELNYLAEHLASSFSNNKGTFNKSELDLINKQTLNSVSTEQNYYSYYKQKEIRKKHINELTKYLDLNATDFETQEFKKSILEFNKLRIYLKLKNNELPEKLTYEDEYLVNVAERKGYKAGISLLTVNEAIKYFDILFSKNYDIRTNYAKKYKGFPSYNYYCFMEENIDTFSDKNNYIVSWLDSDGINDFFAAVMLNNFKNESNDIQKNGGISKILEMKNTNTVDRAKYLEYNFGGISQIGRIKFSDYVYIRPVLRISK